MIIKSVNVYTGVKKYWGKYQPMSFWENGEGKKEERFKEKGGKHKR
jgi:hypothetical protein